MNIGQLSKLRFVFGIFMIGVCTPAVAESDKKNSNFVAHVGGASGLCGNLRVPCGFMAAEDDIEIYDNYKREKVIFLKKKQIKDTLDELCKRIPRYQWTIDDGVINIFPKAAHAHKEGGSSPLERKINQIDISNVTTDQAARIILQNSGLPVVGRAYVGPPYHLKTISLQLKNVTVQHALNELVKADGEVVWHLEYYPPAKGYIVDIYPRWLY